MIDMDEKDKGKKTAQSMDGFNGERTERQCEKAMTRYLSLDRGARVPFSVSRHLMACAKCRRNIAALKMAERAASAPLSVPIPVTDEAVNAVIAKAALPAKPRKMWPGPMVMPSWIIVGILMLLSMAVFVLKTGGLSSEQDLTVAIVFAIVVTLYCVAFVTGNIDYFVKKTGVGLAAA